MIKSECEDLSSVEDKELEVFLSDNALDDFIRAVKKYQVPTAEENLELYHKAIEGDGIARNLLIEKNIRLVIAVAYKYRHRLKNYELLDVIQDGILGLMKAIDKYDESKSGFSTYATLRIKGAIIRGLDSFDNGMHMSLNFCDKRRKYYKMFYEHLEMQKPMPSRQELLIILDITEETLENIEKSSIFEVDSLNRPIDSDSGIEETEFGDCIGFEDESYDNMICATVDNEILFFLKSLLNPQQYYIFYHADLSKEKTTLTDIGKRFGVSRQRIGEIRSKILKKIKPYFKNGELNRYMISDLKYRQIEEFRLEPVEPKAIHMYLYVKDNLTEEEQLVLKNYFFSEKKDYINSIQMKSNMDADVIKKLLADTLEKIANIIETDKESFAYFSDKLTNEYGFEIFSMVEFDGKSLLRRKK